MRRYTGQKALYEAWSVSRSKPKRNGLLERLRPQLEKLHDAVVNARLKAAQSQAGQPKSDGKGPKTEYKPWRADDDVVVSPPVPSIRDVVPPVSVETPAEVSSLSPVPVDSVAERKETPVTTRGQARQREGGSAGKSKGRTPKNSSAPREAAQTLPGFEETEKTQAETPKVEAVNTKEPAVADVEVPSAEAPTTESSELERQKVEEPQAVVEAVQPVPAAVEPTAVATPNSGETESPEPAEWSSSSSPEIDTGADFRPARVVDRLKEFRAQREMQAASSRETRAYMPVNLRPRRLQINAGRIEVSLELKYALFAVLGAVVVILVVFAIGKASGPRQRNDMGGSVTMTEKNPVTNPAVVPEGNNRIVIAQHPDRTKLEPLILYFKENGIKVGTMKFSILRDELDRNNLSTKGVPRGEGFLLVTVDLYNGVDKPGTDGYNAKQKIVELGEKYQPTEGSVPFSRKDVYGLKVK